VGASDGWTDLARNRHLTWHFASADGGNVALVAGLEGDVATPFSLALGFGRNAAHAIAHACAAADADFARVEDEYVRSWHRYCDRLLDLSRASGDEGRLYYLSAMVLRAHEDRENPGAHTASLAVPWGENQGDDNRAGYHLVWPRDLYHAATARLAAGDAPGALRTLHYLGRTQRADGSWPQNFWVFGEPYWHGLQLDEIAFPILLAWQLRKAQALDWNPYPSLIAPAAYRIAKVGPVTQQERWEENSGYSPSTLAAAIAALVCAADFADADRDPEAGRYFREVADYWAQHVEDWTYTTSGGPDGRAQYYERIAATLADAPAHLGRAVVQLANRTGGQGELPESAVIDGGFLELVRYGIRRPDDPHILHSIEAYDRAARVETPRGPSWHRYTFDGYGEKADGRPYDGTGIGRAWPLLTGERAHYALAAGEDPTALRAAMEAFVTAGGMIPEQVWDEPDMPERGLYFGRPSGSAAPLVWAHAEYVKLLRSMVDGAVFDCPEPARRRYGDRHGRLSPVVIWKHNHKIREVAPQDVLRIEVYAPASLHWSDDGWDTVHHDPMEPRGRGVWSFDFTKGSLAGTGLDFTFWWNDREAWEGVNYRITGR
jgi:glucoamylase